LERWAPGGDVLGKDKGEEGGVLGQQREGRQGGPRGARPPIQTTERALRVQQKVKEEKSPGPAEGSKRRGFRVRQRGVEGEDPEFSRGVC
jgi:hypothetical protein